MTLYQDKIDGLMEQFDSFGILEHTLPNAIGMWRNEQECLLWLLLNSNPKYNWVEIGSFCGGSTVLMCLAHRLVGATNKIISLDINYNPMFDLNVYERGKFEDIHEKLTADSTWFKRYNKEKISFLFIDGFHSFKQAVLDFENLMEFFTSDIIVLFHDVSPNIYKPEHWSGVVAYIDSHYDELISSNNEDFRLDEAMVYLCCKYDFRLLNIPVRDPKDFHPQETGLKHWVRGTTSPYNSVGAIYASPSQ